MPKWRKLYTKTVDSLDLNDMPDDFTRLLWVLLPLQLDRCGRGIDNPAWVRSKIFPLRLDVDVDQVRDAMNWYEARGMIERYEKNGRKYFWIPTWHKYQGSTSREGDSEIPAPDSYEDPDEPTPQVKSNSQPTHEQVKSNSGLDVDVDVDVNEDIDIDVDESHPSPNADYQAIRKRWIELFPDKPTPRKSNRTLTRKTKTRMKSPDFRDNWEDALERASKSSFLQRESWFYLDWFLKNDDNWHKCLIGKYDDSDNDNSKTTKDKWREIDEWAEE